MWQQGERGIYKKRWSRPQHAGCVAPVQADESSSTQRHVERWTIKEKSICIIRFVPPDATFLGRTVLTFPVFGRVHKGSVLG